MSIDTTKLASRRFFHSFPRAHRDESKNQRFERGLQILRLIKEVGLVLAPEIVEWDLSHLLLNGTTLPDGTTALQMLQHRVSFTELAPDELSTHSKIFGPISISCPISKLREAGALPVLYVPQSNQGSALSTLGMFCVRGTDAMYKLFNHLRELRYIHQFADEQSRASGGPAIKSIETIQMTKPSPTGTSWDERSFSAAEIVELMEYIEHGHMPFRQCAGVASVFQNMFYPTDNKHSDEILGYFRQREWRIVASELLFFNRPLARPLNVDETTQLTALDPAFWGKEVPWANEVRTRAQLALVYAPTENWSFFDIVDAIYVPEDRIERTREVIGSDCEIRALLA
jgi:hypothetical protein